MSEFPHPGYPIAPHLLRPVLSVGLPVSFARLTDTFPLLADLDERIWSYVDRPVAECLGNFVITRAYQMRTAVFWRMTYFPRLTSALRLDDIRIERVTYQSLSSLFAREIPEGLTDLAKFTLDRLIAEVFGVKPLIDLLAAVHFHIDHSPMSNEEVARLTRDDIEAIIRKPTTWRLYSHKFFPFLPKTASKNDLPLSVRVDTCICLLIEEGLIHNLASLSQLTLRQVMERQNLGVKSLAILLQGISPLVHEPGSPKELKHKFEGTESAHLRPDSIACKALSKEEVHNILREPRKCRMFWERTFPEVPSTTDLADLRLSVRTYNCLSNLIAEGVISKPSDLARLTVGQVMRRMKNFGTKSLADLLNALDHVAVYSGFRVNSATMRAPAFTPLSPDLTWAADKLSASRVGARIRANDPRMHSVLGELLYVANNSSNEPPLDSTATLKDIARRLVLRSHDRSSPSETLNLITQIRLRLAGLTRMKLEAELQSLVAEYVKGRNLNLVLIFLGWDGNPPRTLESAGDIFGITRERVRQVIGKFSKGTHRHPKPFLPTLEKVLDLLARRVPAFADDIEQELCIGGLTLRRFRVESIAGAAKWAGLSAPFVIEQSPGVRLLLARSEEKGLARLISMHARRAVSKYGLANLVDLKEELADITRSFGNEKLISSVVRAMDSYEDLGQGWFWLQGRSRNHMLTVVRKIFAVAPRIHVSEMRAAIANDPRGMGFAPPKEVVTRFCQTAVKCVLDDDFLVIPKPDDPRKVLSEVEHVIFDVCLAHGPLLRRGDLERLCTERGVNRITLGIYLTRHAILAKYSIGIYGLRGATFSPGDLERLSLHRQSRYSDHGWTEHAHPWAAVELSASALSSGAVQLPATLRQQLRGRYALRTEDGLTVGQLVVSDRATWGLGPLFRRRGGEPGDILLLTFDLRRREVTARLGDLSVLPELGNLVEEIVE